MITLVDYNAGNLTSVRRALDHLGIPCQITADPDAVRRADKVIFPGVGAAGAAMHTLRQRGLDVDTNVQGPVRPFPLGLAWGRVRKRH